MSSWLSGGHSRPPPRLGYYQPLPEGTFIQKEKPATVVSAYYEMKSKYDTGKYRQWLRLFLESVQCYLVFFTDESLAPFIEECREKWKDRTKVVILPREGWRANMEFPPGFWEAQYKLDPEASTHSPELYKVWYEKKEFVKRAIALNPFEHDDFVWTDAGIVRHQEVADLIAEHFPVADRIPTDRILLMNVFPFTLSDEKEVKIGPITLKGGPGKHRIGAGVIAANRTLWGRWNEFYDRVLEKYRAANLFVGKEQALMATVVLENKSAISLLDARAIVPLDYNYLLLYLGVSSPVYKRFRVPDSKKRKYSYQELLGIVV